MRTAVADSDESGERAGERRSARASAPDGEGEAARAAFEARLLSDVAHESRNQFHKLYYCAELVRTAVAEDGAAGDLSVAADMLERTVKSLEKLTAGALDYVRPLHLESVSMRVADVASALAAVLRTEIAGEATVRVDDAVAQATVAIDPGRLSSALRAIAAELAWPIAEQAGAGGFEAFLGRAERAREPVVEVRLRANPRELTTEERRGSLVEWALAVKVLNAHGGGVERGEGARTSDCLVWIPLVDEDGTRRS